MSSVYGRAVGPRWESTELRNCCVYWEFGEGLTMIVKVSLFCIGIEKWIEFEFEGFELGEGEERRGREEGICVKQRRSREFGGMEWVCA